MSSEGSQFPCTYATQDLCYYLSEDTATWNEGEKMCQSRYGGHLATVDSLSKFNFLVEKLQAEYDAGMQINNVINRKF